jgi:RNA polymerase sigma-70 factor (ECF subfamily)
MLRSRSPTADPATASGPPGQREEADLIKRIAAGKLDAFETLYKIYHPRLIRFIMSIVHRHHLLEEVFNDTMLVVWNKAGTYDGSSKVSTWIFGIAYRKASKALSRWDDPVSDERLAMEVSTEPGPEQQVGERQVQKVLAGAMLDLSADHRAVVDLAYFHAFGYREISDIVACPVDTVKTRMFHARRHLKKTLSGQLADWL